MGFAIGSLVKARGREWVVLPDSRDELLLLRPLGGMDDEVTGIYLPLEPVESASFSLRRSHPSSRHIPAAMRETSGPFS